MHFVSVTYKDEDFIRYNSKNLVYFYYLPSSSLQERVDKKNKTKRDSHAVCTLASKRNELTRRKVLRRRQNGLMGSLSILYHKSSLQTPPCMQLQMTVHEPNS